MRVRARHIVAAWIATGAGLVGTACQRAPVSNFPFGFTMTASPGELIVPHGAVGIDTLTIASINDFSGEVFIIPDSTVNCSLTSEDIFLVPATEVQIVAACSRPEAGRQGMLFTAVSPGYQTVYHTVLIIQQ